MIARARRRHVPARNFAPNAALMARNIKRGLVLATLTLGCAWALPTAAHHHAGAVGRVGTSSLSLFGPAGAGRYALAGPELRLALSYDFTFFGRALDGSARFERGDLGTAQLHLMTVATVLELPRGTLFGAALPVGVLSTSPPADSENAGRTASGLGDVQLWVGQRLAPLLKRSDSASAPRADLALRAGVSLPTGRYDPSAGLTVTDVVGGPDGSIDIITFDTRTTLGLDTFALMFGMEGALALSSRFALQTSHAVSIPLSQTRDGILWGPDVVGALLLAATILPEWLSLAAGPAYNSHFADSVPTGRDTAGADTGRARLGGRHDVGAAARLFGRLTPRLGYFIRANVPLWQWTGGVQLAETFSLGAALTYSFGS